MNFYIVVNAVHNEMDSIFCNVCYKLIAVKPQKYKNVTCLQLLTILNNYVLKHTLIFALSKRKKHAA